jgi:hypothetical protein
MIKKGDAKGSDVVDMREGKLYRSYKGMVSEIYIMVLYWDFDG